MYINIKLFYHALQKLDKNEYKFKHYDSKMWLFFTLSESYKWKSFNNSNSIMNFKEKKQMLL